MPQRYRLARLHADDVARIHALEEELGQRYGRDIALVPYEKESRTPGSAETPGSAQMDVGRMGGDSIKRGATFAYSPPQTDQYPTLADIATKHDDNPDGLHRSIPEREEGAKRSRREEGGRKR